MNRWIITLAVSTAVGIATAQGPAPAPKANADPYANNPDAGKLKFPLAAPAGKDSGAMKVAPAGAVNTGLPDEATWKFGPNTNPPADAKIWNPVMAARLGGGGEDVADVSACEGGAGCARGVRQ
jgi:hypothetical protein